MARRPSGATTRIAPSIFFTVCSNESAGIGEGMAILFRWALFVAVIVLAVAIISGLIVGRRKGRVARQTGLHLLGGVALLIVTPFVLYGIWQIRNGFQDRQVARDKAIYDAWLAPLTKPVAGQLDRGLAAVFDAQDAITANRRIYLIATLPSLLAPIDTPLNESERAAVLAAAQQLRTESEDRHFGTHPNNLDRLDGAVAWQAARPDVAAALQTCGHRVACTAEVLDAADRRCYRNAEACREQFTPERLAVAEAMVAGDRSDTYLVSKLTGLRSRVRQ